MVHRAFQVSVQVGIPSVLVGDFGIGKTSYAYDFAKFLGLRIIRLPLLGASPEDIIGYPHKVEYEINGRRILVTEHVIYRRVAEAMLGNCLILLDEIGRLDNERMQNVVATLLDRRIGQFALPDNVYFIATLNDFDIGQFDLNLNLISRLAWFRFEPDDEILDRALMTGEFKNEFVRVPENWRDFIPAASSFIMMLRKCRKSAFRRQGQGQSQGQYENSVFPCPRTIFHLRSLLAGLFSLGWKTLDDITAAAAACCGSAFSYEVGALCRSLNIPDTELFIEEFLLAGEKYEFKNDVIANNIMLFTEVSNWIINKAKHDIERARLVWRHAVEYIAKYILEDYAETAIYLTLLFTNVPESIRGILPVSLLKIVKR